MLAASFPKLIFIDKFNVSGIEIHSELVMIENLLFLAGISGKLFILSARTGLEIEGSEGELSV
jgi:hypothetical protein